MYAISDGFREALTRSHAICTKADVYRSGLLIQAGLPVVSGNVSVDRSATVRRRCTLTVVDKTGSLVPSSPLDTLSAYGNEVKLYRGIVVDGVNEYVPLGVFRIAGTDVGDQNGVTISLTGYDRSRSLNRSRLESPLTIASGTDYIEAIQLLLNSRQVGLAYRTIPTTATTPQIVHDQGTAPWEAATKMANSFGYEIFFDVDGTIVIQPEPDPMSAAVVWEYVDGANATFLSVSKKSDDEPGYNGYVVDGEPPDMAPVHAVAYDDDINSARYYLGPYGKVPEFLRSSLVTTQTQADSAAQAGVLRNKTQAEELPLEITPNPAHQEGDLIYTKRSRIGVDGYYTLESFTVPLSATDSMSISARRKRAA